MHPEKPRLHRRTGENGGQGLGGGGTIVYFPGTDCGVMADRAAQNGGKIQNPKMAIGEHGAIAHVLDTEGNLIGLHSMK